MSNGAPAGPSLTKKVTFQSIPARLDGLPMARVALADKLPFRLQAQFASTDVGLIAPRFIQNVGTGPNLRHRINRDTARDIELLVTYDTMV